MSRFEDGAVIKRAANSATVNTTNAAIAAVTGKKIRILALFLASTSAVSVSFRSDNGSTQTVLHGASPLAALGQIVLPYNPAGWMETVSGETFQILTSGSSVCGWNIVYQEI